VPPSVQQRIRQPVAFPTTVHPEQLAEDNQIARRVESHPAVSTRKENVVRLIVLGTALVAVGMMASTPAWASFHLMQVEQIIGGIDGDPTKQAIQLRMRSSFQNQVQLSRIVAWDATGANPIVVCAPGASVANQGAGVQVLIASAGFLSATSPATVADFTMSNLIPASYLAAGSLTFENSGGTTVYWRVSWGGGSYSGSTTGAVTNDADGQFGPVFGAALPSSDTRALLFQGAATALSTNNAADYAVTAGDAVFTNNAGTSFTVQPTATGVASPASPGQLMQNYPNPFNPSTRIDLSLPERSHVTLRVYDASGRLVTTLLDRVVDAGTTRIDWEGRDARNRPVSSGVYFYRLTSEAFSQTRKMVLVK